MRELKFRCFYRGEMYPVEELHFSPDGSFSVGSIKMDLEGLLRSVSPDSEHIEGIMQFTGIKDKTGKDIYEGDIVMFLDRDWIDYEKDTDVLPVVYENDSFVLKDTIPNRYGELCSHYLFKDYGRDRFEIIGNIHQHKHLLK